MLCVVGGNENDDNCDNDIQGNACDKGHRNVNFGDWVIRNENDSKDDINVNEHDMKVDVIASERVVNILPDNGQFSTVGKIVD